MKKKKHLKTALTLSLIPFLFNTGCTKFVAVAPPETQAEASLVFSSDGAAVSAITGLYSRITGTSLALLNGGMTLYPGLSADEFYHTVTNADNDLFLNNSLVPDNGTGNYSRLWRAAYQVIYNANAIVLGVEKSGSLTDSIKAQVKGESLVVRSLCYFYLTNLYGAVPYTTETDYRENQSLTRNPAADIYQHIIADLVQAKALLKASYPTVNRARPNRYTAIALLARVYLYQKEWVKAEAEATEIIQNGSYTLAPLLNNVFIQASPETIWQLAKDNGNTGEGTAFVPSTTTVKPGYALTSYLLNAFEATDKRKTSWLGKNTVSSMDYYYPYKYKVRATTPITEYYVVFRLAEQYLIRSEARAMQNNITGAKADLDAIRLRAGLSAGTATTGTAMLSALEKERQTELFLEWGHRWLDLKRWGRADAVLGPIKSANWQSTDTLYPIPLREVQTNPFLTQNPGY